MMGILQLDENNAGEKVRCPWAKSEKDTAYHDNEWGRPLHDDRALFELFVLEGMQAGLSWSTILNKREGFRLAFENFEPGVVAQFSQEKVEYLMQDQSIVRNRRKICAAIENAKAVLKLQKEFGSFDAYVWSFVEGMPITNYWESMDEVPANTELSDRFSKDLKKRGFAFAGSVVCYSFMQAAGLVNDHLQCCWAHREIERQNNSLSQ